MDSTLNTWAHGRTSAWHQHFIDGKCTPVQARFFELRSVEEFYDQSNDYHNINNLIAAPEHQQQIEAMRQELRRQQLTFDSGLPRACGDVVLKNID